MVHIQWMDSLNKKKPDQRYPFCLGVDVHTFQIKKKTESINKKPCLNEYVVIFINQSD